MEAVILKILEGTPYNWDSAIAAFESHGGQTAFARRLRVMGDTAYTRPILEYQLRCLVGADVRMTADNSFVCGVEAAAASEAVGVEAAAASEAVGVEAAAASEAVGVEAAAASEAVGMPVEVVAAIGRRTNAYQQRAMLANSLHGFGVDDNAGRAAVMQHCEEWSAVIVDCNVLLSYWERHNMLPPPVVDVVVEDKLPTNAVSLVRLLNNTRTYLTKAQKKLGGLVVGSDEYNKVAKQIENYVEKIKRIEAALATPS